MSFNVVLLCGTVTGVILLLLPIKELKISYFSIAVAALSVLVAVYTLKGAIPLFQYLNTFMDSELSLYFKVLLKALGISLVCNVTSDLACELGMNSLSGKVEFAGKVAILLSAIPVFEVLVTELEGLI